MKLNEINKLVIHLPERTDRFDSLLTEVMFLGEGPMQIVNGIRDPNPMIGIGQAHINCILLAKQKEMPYVVIMEDDVLFNGKEKTLDYINTALKNAPNDWELLLGGVYFAERKKPYNEFWDKVGQFCGLHFYIVNSSAYDKILEYDFKEHIDRWMNTGNRLNCYVAKKFFATQSNGYSDNVKQKVNYESKIKKFELL